VLAAPPFALAQPDTELGKGEAADDNCVDDRYSIVRHAVTFVIVQAACASIERCDPPWDGIGRSAP
jgi:hypothetical protein